MCNTSIKNGVLPFEKEYHLVHHMDQFDNVWTDENDDDHYLYQCLAFVFDQHDLQRHPSLMLRLMVVVVSLSMRAFVMISLIHSIDDVLHENGDDCCDVFYDGARVNELGDEFGY